MMKLDVAANERNPLSSKRIEDHYSFPRHVHVVIVLLFLGIFFFRLTGRASIIPVYSSRETKYHERVSEDVTIEIEIFIDILQASNIHWKSLSCCCGHTSSIL